jgi:hypothetical protein
VDLRAGLDETEQLKFLTPPGLEIQSLGRPARYRLRYPGSYNLDDSTPYFRLKPRNSDFLNNREMNTYGHFRKEISSLMSKELNSHQLIPKGCMTSMQ